MSAMAEVVPDTDNQSLQHFINNSPFDEEKLKRQINEDANNERSMGQDPWYHCRA